MLHRYLVNKKGVVIRISASNQVGLDYSKVLTPEAADFLVSLHKKFEKVRRELLEQRRARQRLVDSGSFPDFLTKTQNIRNSEWRVASAPKDLEDRRVEITGPVEAKMMINALNSGAKVFMADFEDSNSPTWSNIIEGQQNLMAAVKRELQFKSPEGKEYKLGKELATLLVRPRGWHLEEKHFQIETENISASLFDFGLYFFHNAHELIQKGSGPYFYLPKLESHLEARLWNDVFNFAQDALKISRGTIRATILIETIFAAFEMEEILYELRTHAAGLNAGRWDYLFSIIKKFRNFPEFVMPDRGTITMTVSFMRAYTELLVHTCHKRKAHAIGGMAAFIPSRKDSKVNENAFAKVREDKKREAGDGFDGTWVAHPDLVPLAKGIFDEVFGKKPHQKERLREEVKVKAADLLNVRITDSKVTEAGVRNNISVALQYIDKWLSGLGAVALYNLMEDAATAEIARSQLWQWLKHSVRLDNGQTLTAAYYQKICEEELQNSGVHAREILDRLVLSREFEEFLTIPAYSYLS